MHVLASGSRERVVPSPSRSAVDEIDLGSCAVMRKRQRSGPGLFQGERPRGVRGRGERGYWLRAPLPAARPSIPPAPLPPLASLSPRTSRPRTQKMSAVTRKAINLAPSALSRPSGVPVARAINLAARSSASSSHDHHGAAGPRADAPPRWAATHSVGPFGLTAKSRVNGASTSSPSERPVCGTSRL